MRPQWIVIVLVGVLAFGVGAFFAMNPPAPVEPRSGGYVLDEPRPLPPVALINESGAAFTQADFEGHWSLLYFGFTYCPDICPSAMAVMAQVKENLDAVDGLDDRYYLVSVDPDRDSPERLAEYVTYFDPAFLGLTGEFDQLDIITLAAGAVYKVPDAPENEDYLVAHSSTLTLIDPQGRVHAIFTSPFNPVSVAEDIRRVAGH